MAAGGGGAAHGGRRVALPGGLGRVASAATASLGALGGPDGRGRRPPYAGGGRLRRGQRTGSEDEGRDLSVIFEISGTSR